MIANLSITIPDISSDLGVSIDQIRCQRKQSEEKTYFFVVTERQRLAIGK